MCKVQLMFKGVNLVGGSPCGDVSQASSWTAEIKFRSAYVDLEDFIVVAIIESHKV